MSYLTHGPCRHCGRDIRRQPSVIPGRPDYWMHEGGPLATDGHVPEPEPGTVHLPAS